MNSSGLRVFYAADQSPNTIGLPRSSLWQKNLRQSLESLGAEVIPFEYDLGPHFRHLDPAIPGVQDFIATHRPHLECELLRQVEAAHRERPVDLFFSYFYSACVTPAVIHAIRDLGIVTLNWYCNAAHQFRLIEELAPAYDRCLVPERFRLDDYRRIGATPIYCQEASNPDIYRPRRGAEDHNVTFVGQAYGDRADLVMRLLEAGVDVRVYGPRWDRHLPSGLLRRIRLALDDERPSIRATLRSYGPSEWSRLPWRSVRRAVHVGRRLANPPTPIPTGRWGGVLSDDELVRMFSRSRINLGFSACSTTHDGDRILQVRLRDFEIPMAGGFYITEYLEELEEHFEIGREIVCYRDPEELVDLVQYYLAHDTERRAIAAAGRRRCLAEHTWEKRFEMVLDELGLLRGATA